MSGGSLLHAATVLSRDARQQRLLTSDIHQLLPVVRWKKVAFCEKAEAFLSLAGSKRQKQMEILGRPILKLRSLLFLFIEGLLLLLRWHIHPMEGKYGTHSKKTERS